MSGTRVQPPPDPPTSPLRIHGRGPRPGWVVAAIIGALGFILGIVVAIGAGAGGGTKTVTVPRVTTVTVRPKAAAPGTVITKVQVPDYTNVRLDVAKSQIHAQGWHASVHGGGLFGVVVDSHWTVVSQQPAPGTYLERGGTISVNVVK